MEVNLRAVVLDILEEIESNNEFSHIIINNALLKYQYLDKSKRSFINKLSLGIIESQIELDYIINKYSKTPVKKMKPVIRRIVRMGVYQIIYMDNVPDSAACNEAVKLAVKRGFAGLKGFVNGVLRNISRNKDNIEYPDYNKSPYEYLSVKYSMPMWIIELWSGQMSIDTVKSVLEGISRAQGALPRAAKVVSRISKSPNADRLFAAFDEPAAADAQRDDVHPQAANQSESSGDNSAEREKADAYADEILAVVRKARVDGIDIESALRNRLRDVEEKVALIESEINND